MFGAVIAEGAKGFAPNRPSSPAITRDMDAALYFELVDAVARVRAQSELTTVTERIMATPMYPLERRVLERAIRARGEALALESELTNLDLFASVPAATTPLAAQG